MADKQNKLNPGVPIKKAIKFYAWIITRLICIVSIFAKPGWLSEFTKFFY